MLFEIEHLFLPFVTSSHLCWKTTTNVVSFNTNKIHLSSVKRKLPRIIMYLDLLHFIFVTYEPCGTKNMQFLLQIFYLFFSPSLLYTSLVTTFSIFLSMISIFLYCSCMYFFGLFFREFALDLDLDPFPGIESLNVELLLSSIANVWLFSQK